MAKVLVGCSYMSVSIDCFDWYKHPSSLYFNTYFLIVDLCASYLFDQYSLNLLNFFLGSDNKLSVAHIQTGHMTLFSMYVCGKSWQFADFMISPVVINKLIWFKSVTQIDYYILIYKNHRRLFLCLVFYIRFWPWGNKAYWVNTSSIFGGFLEIYIYTSQKTVPVVGVVDKSHPKGHQEPLG